MFTSLLAKFGKMFCLALLLASPVSAELVGAQFRDFSGGLNDSTDPTALLPNQSPDILNLVVDDPAGAATPRKGFTTCGKLPSGNIVTELYTYSKSDGNNYMIATDNTNVYQTVDCFRWTRIATGLSSNSKPSFSTVRNDLWFVNGSTWAFKWDGSTTTQIDGTLNTPSPAPPRGRYIEFWRERVWIAATSGDPSILAWSALTDSAGNDITPSTGTGAWPATNALYIDRDGGSRIYGIKAYRDNLYVFKGNGIWRIVFNNDFDITVVRTLSSVGCRFGSSIVELDNLLYFVGQDGIYAFDGDNSVRLSDKIYQKFLSIQQPYAGEGFNIWTNQSDFDNGISSNTTFDNVPGSIYLSTAPASPVSEIDYNFETTSAAWTFSTDSYSVCSSPGPRIAAKVSSGGCSAGGNSVTVPLEGTYSGCIAFSGDPSSCVGGVSEMPTFSLVREILDSSDVVLKSESILGTGSSSVSTQTVSLAGITADNIKIRFRYYINYGGDYSEAKMTSGLIAIGSAPYSLQYTMREYRAVGEANLLAIDLLQANYFNSTGTWTSEVIEGVSLSSWSVFDSDYVSNGGRIDFSVRYASHPTALSTSVWSEIIPGSLIAGASWQNYVQVMASFTAASGLLESPSVESISINYITGGSQTQNIFGGKWRNRYWVSANSNDSVNTKSNSISYDTALDWASGTLIDASTAPYSGFLIGGGSKTKHDDFGDGNLTAAPVWNDQSSAYAIASGRLRSAANDLSTGNNIFSTSTLAFGEWKFNHIYDNANSNAIPGFSGGNYVGMVFQFVDEAPSRTDTTSTGRAYFVQIKADSTGNNPTHTVKLGYSATNVISAGTYGTQLSSYSFSGGAYTEDTLHSWRVRRERDGEMRVWVNGTQILQATDTTISTSGRMGFAANSDDSATVHQEFDNVFVGRVATGTWVGEIREITNPISFDRINASKTELNGTVTFMYRAGNSASELYATGFTTATIGTTIGNGQQSLIQMAIRFNSDQSDQFVSSASIVYLNRQQYNDGYNNLVLVSNRNEKSNWVPYDMMIGPMAQRGDVFYAAASTHSAIYRMDYGTNDSGQLIPWYWTSRDEAWGQPLNRKRLLEISTDFRRASGASAVSVGYSRDQGVTFTNSSFSMAGTGRDTDTRYVNGQNSFDFRLRFGSTSLDVAPTIIGITGWANIQPGRR